MVVDIAASVLAKLKRKARETGRSFQLCLQLFCQEELLRRLEKSKYARNFILKGGLFLYARTNYDSRVTLDVDFLLRNTPNTPNQIENLLNEILTIQTDVDFITFEIIKIEPISIEKKYPGIGATLLARIKNTRIPFCVDFGFGDVIAPSSERRPFPTQLPDFTAPSVYMYSLESFAAEKLDAILYLMEFSSRMKDYYDLWYLATNFDFENRKLTDALRKTFKTRERNYTVDHFEKIIAFDSDEPMKKKWNAFIKKIDANPVDFSVVLSAINSLLYEPFCETTL